MAGLDAVLLLGPDDRPAARPAVRDADQQQRIEHARERPDHRRRDLGVGPVAFGQPCLVADDEDLRHVRAIGVGYLGGGIRLADVERLEGAGVARDGHLVGADVLEAAAAPDTSMDGGALAAPERRSLHRPMAWRWRRRKVPPAARGDGVAASQAATARAADGREIVAIWGRGSSASGRGLGHLVES
jgi:hypothetical protein